MKPLEHELEEAVVDLSKLAHVITRGKQKRNSTADQRRSHFPSFVQALKHRFEVFEKADPYSCLDL